MPLAVPSAVASPRRLSAAPRLRGKAVKPAPDQLEAPEEADSAAVVSEDVVVVALPADAVAGAARAVLADAVDLSAIAAMPARTRFAARSFTR